MKHLAFLFLLITLSSCSTLFLLGGVGMNEIEEHAENKDVSAEWIQGVWYSQVSDSKKYIMLWDRTDKDSFRGQLKKVENGEKEVIQNMYILNDKGFVKYISTQVKQEKKYYKIINLTKSSFRCKPVNKKDSYLKYTNNEDGGMEYTLLDSEGQYNKLTFIKSENLKSKEN